jgi:hypothetical protein
MEVLYPVERDDHAWKWVFDGELKGHGAATMVPQVRELPEEPLVGYWERYLLRLMAGEGEKDVWKFARRGVQVPSRG